MPNPTASELTACLLVGTGGGVEIVQVCRWAFWVKNASVDDVKIVRSKVGQFAEWCITSDGIAGKMLVEAVEGPLVTRLPKLLFHAAPKLVRSSIAARGLTVSHGGTTWTRRVSPNPRLYLSRDYLGIFRYMRTVLRNEYGMCRPSISDVSSFVSRRYDIYRVRPSTSDSFYKDGLLPAHGVWTPMSQPADRVRRDSLAPLRFRALALVYEFGLVDL